MMMMRTTAFALPFAFNGTTPSLTKPTATANNSNLPMFSATTPSTLTADTFEPSVQQVATPETSQARSGGSFEASVAGILGMLASVGIHIANPLQPASAAMLNELKAPVVQTLERTGEQALQAGEKIAGDYGRSNGYGHNGHWRYNSQPRQHWGNNKPTYNHHRGWYRTPPTYTYPTYPQNGHPTYHPNYNKHPNNYPQNNHHKGNNGWHRSSESVPCTTDS